jgi:hypothetical protein
MALNARTSSQEQGQIYIGTVNWALMVGMVQHRCFSTKVLSLWEIREADLLGRLMAWRPSYCIKQLTGQIQERGICADMRMKSLALT